MRASIESGPSDKDASCLLAPYEDTPYGFNTYISDFSAWRKNIETACDDAEREVERLVEIQDSV